MSEVTATIGQELISPEAVKVLTDVREYLDGVESKVTIENEGQKRGAVELGNSLQKRYRELDTLRATEKKPYDEKGKAVQERFKPTLLLIDQKKSELARAITAYDQEQDRIARIRQAELEAKANAERASIEALAISREERAAMYRKKYEDTNAALIGCPESDTAARIMLNMDLLYYANKVSEFEAKATMSREQAAGVTAAIVMTESPGASKGTRKLESYEPRVVDIESFLKWVIATKYHGLVMVDLQKLKMMAKASEGLNPPSGIEYVKVSKTGFSGR